MNKDMILLFCINKKLVKLPNITLFSECKKLVSIPDFSKWNVSNVGKFIMLKIYLLCFMNAKK